MDRIYWILAQYCFPYPVPRVDNDKIQNNSSQEASCTEKSKKEI